MIADRPLRDLQCRRAPRGTFQGGSIQAWSQVDVHRHSIEIRRPASETDSEYRRRAWHQPRLWPAVVPRIHQKNSRILSGFDRPMPVSGTPPNGPRPSTGCEGPRGVTDEASMRSETAKEQAWRSADANPRARAGASSDRWQPPWPESWCHHAVTSESEKAARPLRSGWELVAGERFISV